jgi:hypothetical protein
LARDLDQQPVLDATAPDEAIAAPGVVEWSLKAPVTAQGVAAGAGAALMVVGADPTGGTGGEMNGDVGGGSGLRPGLAISVDPKGIPTLRLPRLGIAGIVAAPLSAGAQALDDPPTMPPPSNVDVCAAVASGAVQPVLAGGAGLMPGAVSSVASSGMPTGPTLAPAPSASGVATMGDGSELPFWATAQPYPNRLTARAIVEMLFVIARPPATLEGPTGSAGTLLASAPSPCGRQ